MHRVADFAPVCLPSLTLRFLLRDKLLGGCVLHRCSRCYPFPPPEALSLPKPRVHIHCISFLHACGPALCHRPLLWALTYTTHCIRMPAPSLCSCPLLPYCKKAPSSLLVTCSHLFDGLTRRLTFGAFVLLVYSCVSCGERWDSCLVQTHRTQGTKFSPVDYMGSTFGIHLWFV